MTIHATEPHGAGSSVPPPASPATRRLLVAWFRFTPNGGINRFIQLARSLDRFGHHVGFLSMSGDTEPDWPDFPGRVLTLAEARRSRWDAVMVPGAGAPDEKLEELSRLRDPCFGLRIQHILSDTSILDGFNTVNEVFEPDLVVFNNSQWQPRDFRHLAARAFHVVPGAVDTELYYPLPLRQAPLEPPFWRIGAYAGRCLEPVLEAVATLPGECVLHLFGGIPAHLSEAVRALMRAGRVEARGALYGAELADFYREMDLFVAVQDRAGWCCPAAEAMTSGLPSVVGRRGTVDFARHEENALIVEAPAAEPIAAALRRLLDDAPLRTLLARRAAAAMRRWSWHDYGARLLEVIEMPLTNAYFRIPELGLFGKWEPETRFAGLEGVIERAAGATVLDLGAAEGIVGWFLARSGARLIHGFEMDASRVAFANEVLGPTVEVPWEMRAADLADWAGVEARHRDLLRPSYDVVLMLGLYHHLPAAARRAVLAGAVERCRRWLVIRTDLELLRQTGGWEALGAAGFTLVDETAADAAAGSGWLGVFERRREAPAGREKGSRVP